MCKNLDVVYIHRNLAVSSRLLNLLIIQERKFNIVLKSELWNIIIIFFATRRQNQKMVLKGMIKCAYY